jgi:bifunctional DNase/RNase
MNLTEKALFQVVDERSEKMETEHGSGEQRPVRRMDVRLSKAKWCLLGCGIVIILLILSSVFLPYKLIQAVRWLGDNSITSTLRGAGEQQNMPKENEIEMLVANVGIARDTSQPVVLLKEKNGERYLPLLIGLAEVNAIAVVMEHMEVPRPLTPDLLCTIVDKLGGKVDRVVITDLRSGVFYATVSLNACSMKMDIDARPSDAIAIAMRVKAPIYATRELLDKAGVKPDNETDKHTVVYMNELSPVF